jgi:hypothetical protein
MTSRFATPPKIEKDMDGYHISGDVAKSWNTLEQCCRQIVIVLRSSFEKDYPKIPLHCSWPSLPSEFGYLKAHRTKAKAEMALSESRSAFELLFAYVSFCIAICRIVNDPVSVSSSTSVKPRWFQVLSNPKNKIHPEWLQLLVDSPIADFSTTPQRRGAIINVSRCSWIHLVPTMLKANVPIWLYWGIPPVFVQPLDTQALKFAPRSHPQSRAPPLPVTTPSQSFDLPTPSQSDRSALSGPGQLRGESSRAPPLPVTTPSQSFDLPTTSQSDRSAHSGPGQRQGESWKDFMIRQNIRRKEILKKETDDARKAREGRENTAAKKSCPGKKGPTVFLWEEDGGVWTRTYVARGLVDNYWGGKYGPSKRIYNSIDNCWDVCLEFDAGTLGESYEYDSNDSDDDTYRPKQTAQVSSDCTPMLLDPTPPEISSDPSMPVDSSDPKPQSAAMPAQVTSDYRPILVDSRDPAPENSSDLPMLVDPTPAQVTSDYRPILVDSRDPAPENSSDLPMLVDPTPAQISDHPTPQPVPTPALVASVLPPVLVDSRDPASPRSPIPLQTPNPQSTSEGDFVDSDDAWEDLYDVSRQDVLNAHFFEALELEEVPIVTLDDLLYYRYGFSLQELPYTGIPSSVKDKTRSFRSWTEVCRAVGGQQLESSAVDRKAIQDFLSILAGCSDPFEDVPGKYWDLSPSGCRSIVDLDKVFISIEERQFTNCKHYIIRPRSLHPSRDMSWLLSVDSMTALECIRRGLGPHTIDIANFLISHGVRFRTLQRISNSSDPDSERLPDCPPRRYLGYRSVDHSFDLADFAGYETLRDSFLRSQSHGPLALREGGIIARLAREVLPNSNALSGPSSEALSGHSASARFRHNDEIYVDDQFSDAELQLICGTYVLGKSNVKGGNEFSFFFQLLLI